ncbi:MAG TPA: DUF3710 domain-containing protein [Catenuloplanes sp.]
MIFSRNRGGSGRHARTDGRGPETRQSSGEPAPAPERGPYDISQAPTGVQRLDLGSLQIPAIDGVEVQVQANPDGGVEQVLLVDGTSALQIGVFAAPRSEGIWDDIRAEIAASLTNDGVTPREERGEYGVELCARVPTPNGPADIRFVGVDGPRWMVRAVYQGPAAGDPSVGGSLRECLAGLVVDRGNEAKPVSEPLALRLPREVAEQAQRDAAAADQAPEGSAGPTPSTNGAGTGNPRRSTRG